MLSASAFVLLQNSASGKAMTNMSWNRKAESKVQSRDVFNIVQSISIRMSHKAICFKCAGSPSESIFNTGISYVLLSVVMSCLASMLSEKIMKVRCDAMQIRYQIQFLACSWHCLFPLKTSQDFSFFTGESCPWQAGNSHFYIQKVNLDVGSFFTSASFPEWATEESLDQLQLWRNLEQPDTGADQ